MAKQSAKNNSSYSTAQKIAFISLGLLLSFVIPFLGVLLTNVLENSFGIVLSIVTTFVLAFYLLKNKNKYLGIGVCIGLIPVLLTAFSIVIAGQLH